MSEEATLDDFDAQGESNDDSSEHPRFGSLPNDWKIREIANIAEVVGGSTPSTSNEDYWGGGIPWATPTDITALSGNIISETEDAITEEGLESASTHILPPKSVLMTSRATIGKCAINTVEMATNQGFKNLIPSDEIEPWYLYYRMLDTAPFLNSLGSGSTFDEVSKTEVQSVDIPIPPLPEQRKIATVLYTVDRAIEKTEKIIERVNRIKKGFKQDVFAEGYFDHQSHQESQIGKIPESWKIESAADLCDGITVGVVTGATDSYVSPSEGVPFIRSQDVHENHIEQDSLKYISEEFHEQQNSSELREGDVITVRTGEPGTSCVIPPELDGANCFSLIISRPKEEINERFYSYYVNSEKALEFIDSWKAGGVQDNFNIGVMERLPVPVPTVEEQQAIVDSLDDINERLEAERQYRNHLQRLKRGLMQDLLSGTVRTTDTNMEVPEEIASYG